jgi:hypothetical protein
MLPCETTAPVQLASRPYQMHDLMGEGEQQREQGIIQHSSVVLCPTDR